jgi:molybdate transport system substrate-binding protein
VTSNSPTLTLPQRLPGLLQIFLSLTLTLIAAFTTLHAQQPLRIAAAADLAPVLPPILTSFEQSTGIHAEATFQASATLTSQIQNGAPFDLFLSADLSYPQGLIDANLALGPTPTSYARGTLVLWTRNDSPLPAPTLALLTDPNLHHLAIANPDRAPYGRAAVALLINLKLYDTLKPKLATADNISQAAQFADSANADAGLISLTSALTPQLSADGHYFVVPANLYPPIEQAAVILKASSQQHSSQLLLDFLLSPPIQTRLAKGGLTPIHP